MKSLFFAGFVAAGNSKGDFKNVRQLDNTSYLGVNKSHGDIVSPPPSMSFVRAPKWRLLGEKHNDEGEVPRQLNDDSAGRQLESMFDKLEALKKVTNCGIIRNKNKKLNTENQKLKSDNDQMQNENEKLTTENQMLKSDNEYWQAELVRWIESYDEEEVPRQLNDDSAGRKLAVDDFKRLDLLKLWRSKAENQSSGLPGPNDFVPTLLANNLAETGSDADRLVSTPGMGLVVPPNVMV